MENIQIRPATIADLQTLLRFEQGVITAERPFDSTLKPDPLHYYDIPGMIASPDVQLLVAELVDHSVAGPATQKPAILVGSGYARIEPSKPYNIHPLHAYLGFMYVHPDHRGKNVNTLIIEDL